MAEHSEKSTSGKPEAGETHGCVHGTIPPIVTVDDERDERDVLAPLGRPISRGSVLHRMGSRASRTSRASGGGVQMELLLRSQTRESGRVAHSIAHSDKEPKAGVLETTAVVDLGHGPEEVCVIEWVDGDPDVSDLWRLT